MSILLHLDSSPLDTSVSRELTHAYATNWLTSHPGGHVIRRDLALAPPTVVDSAWIAASFTPDADRQPHHRARLSESEELLRELETADEYVIGVAMHNFGIPSSLKLWIDQIARAGRTFSYGAGGPRGLLLGKKATVVIASGGAYEAGTPMAAYDFTEPYLRTVLAFLGVTDVTFVRAGGTSALMTGSVARDVLLQEPLRQVHLLAAGQ